MKTILILSLVIVVLAVTFAFQNYGTISISFLLWQFEGSLALVLLLTFFAGILIGTLTSFPTILKGRLEFRRQKKTLTALENSLDKHVKQFDDPGMKSADVKDT